MLTKFFAYARALLNRPRIDREIQDELRFHLDREVQANLAQGLSPAEARRVALAHLGGLSQTAESIRAVRATGLGRLRTDLRDAVRGLRSGRATTVLAFCILSLTMAAGTITFSVVDGVALRPLPYASPDRLVDLSSPSPIPGRRFPASPQDYFTWRERAQTLESVGAARPSGPLEMQIAGVATQVTAIRVTANLFDVLGVRPVLGSVFGTEHERPGGATGVILSHDVWARRLGADRGILGRRLLVAGELREVIGVLPVNVWYPMTGPPTDIYLPYVATAGERQNGRCCIFAVGRLREGVTVAQARADVQRISSAVVEPLQDQVVGPAKRWLLLVLTAVAFVLLVACVNVANLLLARGVVRARELATREVLGASRRRLVFVLILEGLILALASAAVAVAVSIWGVELAKANLPPELTRVTTIAVNGRVLVVSIGAAIVCGVLFASAPAWVAARRDLVVLMKATGGPIIGGRPRDRALAAFLVADVAFVSLLLFAATLVVTSFVLITTADLGFERENVMWLNYRRFFQNLPQAEWATAADQLRADLVDRTKAVPGVTAAAVLMGGAPLSGSRAMYSMVIPGYGETKPDESPESHAVTSDYFRAMGLRLIRGRLFEPSDRRGAPLVMLINDVAARRFFRDRDPIGQVVTLREPATIVGILQGVSSAGPEAAVPPEVYIPLDQEPYINFSTDRSGALTFGVLVVRAAGDPRALGSAVREAIRPALGSEPPEARFFGDDFRRLTASRRFNAALLATFGIIAVAIGAIGIYGTMSFVVTQQVRAIGLRMALGASSSAVMRSVLREALRRVAIGTAIGLAGAWTLSSVLASFVFGIRATEPAVYGGVVVFLGLVGYVAALVPALRASRLDPIAALRQE